MRLSLGQQVTTRDGITGTLVRVEWPDPEATDFLDVPPDTRITIDTPGMSSHDRTAGDVVEPSSG